MSEAAWQTSDGWAPFLEGTADRPPMPFLDRALEFLGERGNWHERLAIDLGCGGGADTIELLRRGWRVFATDGSPAAERLIRDRVDAERAERLTIAIGTFTEVDLPSADLVYAQFSLPFAGPQLEEAVARALDAVKPGGIFAGHLFGANDDWAGAPDVAGVDRAWIDDAFRRMSEVVVDETDEDGPYGLRGKTKHWHYYFVLARR